MTTLEDNWISPQQILVILAHPDDPDFFCGGSIARWIKQGHIVKYYLLTQGDKGFNDRKSSPEKIALTRQLEQRAAAAVLGVQSVTFLNYQDGYLVPSLDIRKDVVRIIRKERPDILVTCDPTNLFPRPGSINHPDHRAAGQIVVDATFPASGNSFYFQDLLEAGLEPHSVKEVWLSVAAQPNVTIDVTEFWGLKIQALHEHKSQIGNPQEFDKRMQSRKTPESTPENPRYEEKFFRIVFG
jgi:LmbE family N-acetylglucosaminyl deacetylase